MDYKGLQRELKYFKNLGLSTMRINASREVLKKEVDRCHAVVNSGMQGLDHITLSEVSHIYTVFKESFGKSEVYLEETDVKIIDKFNLVLACYDPTQGGGFGEGFFPGSNQTLKEWAVKDIIKRTVETGLICWDKKYTPPKKTTHIKDFYNWVTEKAVDVHNRVDVFLKALESGHTLILNDLDLVGNPPESIEYYWKQEVEKIKSVKKNFVTDITSGHSLTVL